jgi:hypothetical protein
MRTVVGYIPSGYLNSAASPTSTGSQEATTGLAIATGLNVGNFLEVSDSDAKAWSNPNTATYVNQLYGGVYMWVALDPAVTGGAISVGTAVFWLESNAGIYVTTTSSANAPDYAGVTIDPNFGPLAASSSIYPYAFIQVSGKATVLFDAALTHSGGAFGDSIGLKQSSTGVWSGTWDDLEAVGATTAANLPSYMGVALAVPVASTASLVRIIRPVVRF